MSHNPNGISGPSSDPQLNHPRNRPSKSPVALWLLLLVVAVIGILSMPREEYSGDARVLRCGTVALINYGDIDVPARLAQGLESNSGNYFFENSVHKFYSKYGILNDLLYVPPLLVQKWHDGRLEFLSDNRAIYLNWFNIIVTVATAWYLYLIASRYTSFQSLAVIFVLTAFYCTFWWNYLRAQSYDIYQVLFLLGFYYHFTASFRLSEMLSSGGKGEGRRDLFLAGTWCGALILVKTVYLMLIPVICLLLVLSCLGRSFSYAALLRRAAWIALPVFCALCLLLAANTYEFGSPLESGWGQSSPVFSGNILAGLYGFLFTPGYSIFLCFPILTFALFGYPQFSKSYRLDTLLFSSIGILMLLVYSKFDVWSGGWGYGPRYMLPYLPLLSLPFLITMEFLLNNWRTWWAATCAAMVAGALLLSFHRQMEVNALPFFAYYKLENFFLGFHMPEVDTYFKSHTLAAVDADLLAYKSGKPWPVLELMEPVLNAKGIAEVNSLVALNTVSNYYFWP